MSVNTNQNKIEKTILNKSKIGFASLLLASTAALTACDTKTDTDELVADKVAQQPMPDANVVCSEDNIKSVITESITKKLSEATLADLQSTAEAEKVVVDPSKADEKMNTLIVDVLSVKASENQASAEEVTCKASINVIIPAGDIENANKLYAANNQKSLVEQLAESNMILKDNVISTETEFSLNAQSAVPVIRDITNTQLVVFASGVLASSAVIDKKNLIRVEAEEARKAKAAAKKAKNDRARKAAAKKARAEKARKAAKRAKGNNASLADGSPINKGMNTSIEAKPKISDSAPVELKVPDAEKVKLEIVQGTDTY